MKRVFISGFRWSGSSALEELVQENFRVCPIVGDELIFFSKGVLPIIWPRSFSIFERTLAPFFFDPFNHFGRISRFKFWFIKTLVFFISFRKKWISSYHQRYYLWFGADYILNEPLLELVGKIDRSSQVKDHCAGVEEVYELICYLTDVVLEHLDADAILLNNFVPARFVNLLKKANESADNIVFCIRRDVEDQAREIKKNSFWGPLLSHNRLSKNLLKQYAQYNDSNLIVSFEDIILDDKKRDGVLNRISVFLGLEPASVYRISTIKNSHLNISKHL